MAAVMLVLFGLPLLASGQSEGAADGEQQTIVWNDVHSGTDADAIRAVAQMFEEQNPGTTVEVNISEHESAKTQVRLWVTADSAPDVIGWQSGNYRFHQFTRAGMVRDVTSIWDEKGFDDVLTISRESVSVDGTVYGVPMWRLRILLQ
jgi:ABC-type glycerol-3-phosphate transport system substrate-binding protein